MKNSRLQLIIPGIFILTVALGCNLGKYLESSSSNTANQSNSARQNTNSESKNSAEAIRSTEIIKAFDEDVKAANAKYKGKTILVSGKITNINDVVGVKALFLRDSEKEPGLQTYLEDNDDAKKVKVGDEVIVRGKVRGDTSEVLDDAVVVEVK